MDKISIVVPVYNEEGNISRLCERIKETVGADGCEYETIFVDDGSSDGTYNVLSGLCAGDRSIKVVRLTRNFGQTAALSAGFNSAGHDLIVTMDADMQNDPADIGRLVKKLQEGYDVVNGWRKERKDTLLRRFASFAANIIISFVTGIKLKDYGCTLKAYRKFFIEKISLYGEMHRFLPAYLHLIGARIAEIPVSHRPRTWGRSKYGFGRIFRVVLDLFTAKFFTSYLTKPIYIFGGIGLALFTAGVMIGFFVLYQKYSGGVWVHKNPLLLLAMFLGILGIQFIVLGLLAEILIRSYFEGKNEKPYIIGERLNF